MKEGNINKIKSGDFYIINDIKVSSDDPNLLYDYTSMKYVLFSKFPQSHFIKGIVEIQKNGRLKRGYFVCDKFINITMVLNTGNRETAKDYSIVQNNYNYRENISNGYFYHYKVIKALDFKSQKNIQQEEKRRLPYSLNGGYQKEFETIFKNNKLEIGDRTKHISKIIGKYSFGFEFETTHGFIPPRLSGPVGLVPLRDGSISGIEYATIPLSGDKGLEALKRSVELLKDRTQHDSSCSMHLHIGGVPRTKKFILSLYLLTLFIQDDMFTHFPITKKYNWRIKNKNYNKPYNKYDVLLKLDKTINKGNIDKNFNVLLEKLAMTSQLNGEPLSNIVNHPNDPSNLHKWQVTPRYHWLNFIPLIFINKKTIEFRIHTPTTDINKIISYLILCTGIVKYAEKHADSILKNYSDFAYNGIKVQEVIKDLPRFSGNNIRGYVLEYFKYRRSVTEVQNRKGEISGDESNITSYNIIEEGINIGSKRFEKKTIKKKSFGNKLQDIDYAENAIVNKSLTYRNRYNKEPMSSYRSYSNTSNIGKKVTSNSFNAGEVVEKMEEQMKEQNMKYKKEAFSKTVSFNGKVTPPKEAHIQVSTSDNVFPSGIDTIGIDSSVRNWNIHSSHKSNFISQQEKEFVEKAKVDSAIRFQNPYTDSEKELDNLLNKLNKETNDK